MLAQVRDLDNLVKKLVGGDAPDIKLSAISWFGTKDFFIVCALAGYDGQAVLFRLGDRLSQVRAYAKSKVVQL